MAWLKDEEKEWKGGRLTAGRLQVLEVKESSGRVEEAKSTQSAVCIRET